MIWKPPFRFQAESALIAVASIIMCFLTCSAESNAQPAAAGLMEDRTIEITPETQSAIDRGLSWLAEHQQEDGAWSLSNGRNTGVVSFATLAFMASGNVPNEGLYGANVMRSVQYILQCAHPSGLIIQESQSSHGPMYEHAMSTVLLAESYGMMPDGRALRDRLERAVDLIINTQNRFGGWRYQPRVADADISVTVMCLLALKAADNAGLHVPEETIDAAVGYVKSCSLPNGGFSYQPGVGDALYGRSAAGTFSLLMSGAMDAPETLMGLKYLQDNKTSGDNASFFYGRYYGAMSMYQAADPAQWKEWFPPVRQQILGMQASDGHWEGEAGPVYGTAMATLVLAVPFRYLPIYQR